MAACLVILAPLPTILLALGEPSGSSPASGDRLPDICAATTRAEDQSMLPVALFSVSTDKADAGRAGRTMFCGTRLIALMAPALGTSAQVTGVKTKSARHSSRSTDKVVRPRTHAQRFNKKDKEEDKTADTVPTGELAHKQLQ